jgi:hypothetical protein
MTEHTMTEHTQQESLDSTIVDSVKNELNGIDAMDVSEHAARYEALHQKLQETLSGIDGL